MKLTKADKVRWAITALLAIITVVIASLTIGRDIYYGTRDEGLLSFAILSLTGYIFVFLFVPVEPAFIYYLTGNVNIWELNAIAIVTCMIAQTIDYTVGYMLSTKVIERFIRSEKYEKAEDKIRKYGNLIIVFFNIMPLSSPVISLAAGMLKYKKKDAFIYTLIGTILKFLSLTLIFRW